MLNDKIQNLNQFKSSLLKAEDYLLTLHPTTPYIEFEHTLQEIGFERGWGDNAERSLDTINLLLNLVNAPDPSTLNKFLTKIPLIFNVVILSPHGFFAQENVLGFPDTGGQVVSRTVGSSNTKTCIITLHDVSIVLGGVYLGSSSRIRG